MNERAIYKLYSIMKFQKSPVDFDEVRSQLFRAREGMETEIDALIFASKLNVYSILCNTVKAKRLDVVKALIMEMDQACDLPIEICRWAVYAWASLFGKDELVKNCNYTFGVWSRRKGNLDTALVFFKEAAEAGHELALEQLLLLIPNENPNEFHEMNEWSDNGFDKVHAILKNFDTRVVFDKNEIVNSIIWLANGNIYASFILGLMYYYGYGRYVLRDRTEAAKWFHEAAKYEHSLAAYWLGAYYEHEELNFYRAFPYYKIAARRGYLDAYWNLAEFYSVGAEIEKDIDKALECYQRGLCPEMFAISHRELGN